MHNQTACCLISVALAMITGVFAQPADAAETDLNILSFPCISTAPVMDGKVAANEYGGQFSGMINIDTQSSYIYDSTLFTACDDETIYIAAQLELPEDGSVQPLALERDTSRLQNNADTLVVMLRPDDDAEAHRFSGYYFTVEPGGQIFDSVRDIDWDGGSVSNAAETDFVAETASNVEDGVWTVEVRIPRKKVDLVNNKPFLMSVGFKLVGISKRLSRNLHPIWFDHYNAFSRATFTDASIKVGTGNLVAGAVSPVVEIWNQAKDEVNGTITALAASARTVETVEDFDFNVKIGQEFHTETEGRIYQWGQAFQLAAGEKITLQDHHEIQNPDSYLLVVTASVDDKLLYRQALPFQSYPPLMIEYAPVPSREDIKATAAFHGSRQGVAEKLTLEFKNEAAESVKEDEFPVTKRKQSVTTSMRELSPGKYTITARLLDRNGETLAKVTDDFEKWKTPEWLENPVALDALSADWVPHLWEPVKIEDNSVTLWGRVFDFSNGKLLPNIVSQSETVIGANNIEYTIDGREYEIEITDTEMKTLGAGRAEVRQRGLSEHFKMTAVHTIEFDGLELVDLQITPTVTPLAIDSMSLDIPLRNITYYMAMPRWTVGTLKDMDMGHANYSVFFANDRVGFGWLVENWKGWVINSAKPRMKIETDGTAADVFKMLLVNEPSELARPMELRFTLHPTPVKPQPEGWRKWRFEGIAWCGARAQLEVDGEQIDVPLQSHWMASPSRWAVSWGVPVPRDNALKKMAEFSVEHGKKVYPFICTCRVNPDKVWSPEASFNVKGIPKEYIVEDPAKSEKIEEVIYYKEDWCTVPAYGMGGNYFTDPSSSFTDYFAWWMQKYADAGCHGIYMDLNGVRENFDQRKGFAYETKDGVLEGTRPFLALRDYYKRIYWVFEQRWGENNEPCMLGHAGAVAPVYQSLWSLMFGGEGLKPADYFVYSDWYLQTELNAPGERVSLPDPEAKRNYEAIVYRTIYPYQQTGIPQMVLPQYGKGMAPKKLSRQMYRDPRLVREILAFSFLHNHFLWPAWIYNPTVYDFWEQVEIPFGMGDTEFHSYRTNTIETGADYIKASYWKKKDRNDYLVAIANWSKEDVTARIKLPHAIVSLGTVSDMEDGSSTPTTEEDGMCEIAVPKLDLRVLRFREHK